MKGISLTYEVKQVEIAIRLRDSGIHIYRRWRLLLQEREPLCG